MTASVTCPKCNKAYEEGSCGIPFNVQTPIAIRCSECDCQFNVRFERKWAFYILPFLKRFRVPKSKVVIRGNG